MDMAVIYTTNNRVIEINSESFTTHDAYRDSLVRIKEQMAEYFESGKDKFVAFATSDDGQIYQYVYIKASLISHMVGTVMLK